MNFETKLTTEFGLGQQLNLAPQLLQWLKLLQLPTADLCTLVRQEMETNPSLEDEDSDGGDETDADAEPVIAETDFAAEPTSFDDKDIGEKFEMLGEWDNDWQKESGPSSQPASSDDEEKRQFMMDSISARTTLVEHLLGQLTVSTMAQEDRPLAELLIGSLDERGYLATPPAELAAAAGIPVEKLEAVLSVVQTFTPAGIGARDLRECLLLQIPDAKSLDATVVRDYLEALGRGQTAEIADVIGVTEEELLEARDRIVQMNPAPGRNFTDEQTRYITPDVILRKADGDYVVELNEPHLPRLRISAHCRRMLESNTLSAEDIAYLRKKIRAASFLIQGIRQRQETMKKVTREILFHQREFFETTAGALMPLTMARVAQTIGVHETTVSRAVSNKFIETPRGVFEMKFFFQAGYQCDDGSALIPAAVKELITNLINNENPGRPLTDLQLVDELKKKGLHIARRTMAKYREELGIPSSKERLSCKRSASVALAKAQAIFSPTPVAAPQPLKIAINA
ncbi:MAG: RNA polymerase factor sigma-54 [Lentisphaerae bacterium]|nr:RNA polymerase factor sigma-54 [Lentisphaerota bacterium]